jgi:type IV conjugative transfer system protein TraL
MEKNYKNNVISSNLDNPKRILGFTIPEIVIVIAPICIAVFFSGFVSIFLVFVGFFIRKKYINFVRRTPINRIKTSIYWYLPNRKNSIIPKSYIREYIS